MVTITKGKAVKRKGGLGLAGNGAPSTWPPRPFQGTSHIGKWALAGSLPEPHALASPGEDLSRWLGTSRLHFHREPSLVHGGRRERASAGDWSVQTAGDMRPPTPPGTQPSRLSRGIRAFDSPSCT